MEPVLVTSDTLRVESIAENYFSPGVWDARFLSSDYASYQPQNSLESEPIEFALPALRSSSVYRMNQALLSVQVQLTKADSSALPTGSLTAPENNILATLFSKQLITLNECPVRNFNET